MTSTSAEPEPAAPRPGQAAPGPRQAAPRTASDSVVAHLEHLILDGAYRPGDSLPSESELAAQLEVSRLTVREGVRSLAARGLVQVSHGRRPVVAAPNASQLRDFFSSTVRRDASGLLELLDVRLAIEVHAADLAARNASDAQVASLEAALQAMSSAPDDDTFTAADLRFHHDITEASGNRMISLLVEGMVDPLKTARLQSLRGYLQDAPDVSGLIEEHRAILEQIAARDPAGAARAMRKHLATTRRDLLRAFAS